MAQSDNLALLMGLIAGPFIAAFVVIDVMVWWTLWRRDRQGRRTTMLKRGGMWPVIVPRHDDIEIADNQTLRHECGCGAELELVHLQDMDSYNLWYGGLCGQCSYDHHVEVGGDTLHCRDCETPLVFDSASEWEEHMHCPVCSPTANRAQ